MILMPELCYYCREELNFGDMTLHDGHRVHKKCLPPTNDTNKWDEAARNAAEDYFDNESQDLILIITKHHADLKATYEKLVELAVLRNQRMILAQAYMTADKFAEMNASSQGFHLNAKIVALETDPLVVAAIERRKGV